MAETKQADDIDGEIGNLLLLNITIFRLRLLAEFERGSNSERADSHGSSKRSSYRAVKKEMVTLGYRTQSILPFFLKKNISSSSDYSNSSAPN